MDETQIQFTGVAPWTDTAGISGVQIKFKDSNSDAKWEQYSSGNEDQYQPFLETDNCTGFSLTRVIEKKMNRMISLGLTGPQTMKFLQDNGYLNAQGKVELSERAVGAMAGTSENGNNFPNVYSAATQLGLIPNSKWPWDYSKERTYASYYAQPTADLYALAKQFLNYFSFDYQAIAKDQIDAGLKISPLWIAIPVCRPWAAFVQYDGVSKTMQHAVDINEHTTGGYVIEDDYNPYFKTLSPDYYIPAIWIVEVMAKETPMNTFVQTINYNGTVGVFVPVSDPSQLVLLNNIFNVSLQANADGSIPTEHTVVDKA